ncbi:MAG: histidine phosphatase family protein [Spirochaetes bacterium]|nr:histidine phosphatase family protein [Spirochaetota bacterium]
MNEHDEIFAGVDRDTTIYLIRHGESEANARNIVQGLTEWPLNDRGRLQASAAGAWLAGKGIGSLRCSPLARARETADIVSRTGGLPDPVPDPLFRELDTGCFSGLPIDESRERFPDIYAEFEYLSWDGVPDAEHSDALYERALEAWAELLGLASGTGAPAAAVSHGGFIQWLVRSTFGCRSWMPLLPTGNCGIFTLVVMPTRPGKPPHVRWKHVNLEPAVGLPQVMPIF